MASSLRVLIVDDSPLNRRVTQSLLRSMGHQAWAAESGAAALELASHQPVDIVLIDSQMPGLDGAETAVQLRRLPNMADVMLLGLTGSDDDRAHESLLQAGAVRILTKPLNADELIECIELWQRRVDQEPAESAAATPVFDPAILTQYDELVSASQPHFLSELVDIYRDNEAVLQRRMAEALEQRDGPGLAAAAHQLKGSCGTVGGRLAAEAAAAVVAAGSAEDWDAAQTALPELHSALRQLNRELDVFLAQRGHASPTVTGVA